ncbi:hypothetical protein KBY28_21045 [Ruegeria pomeroyi]|nr:hypothetical protein [Ruegeria pomeroyi]
MEHLSFCSEGIEIVATIFVEFHVFHGELKLAGDVRKQVSVIWERNIDWEVFQNELLQMIHFELSQDVVEQQSGEPEINSLETQEWSLAPDLEADLQAELREIEAEFQIRDNTAA